MAKKTKTTNVIDRGQICWLSSLLLTIVVESCIERATPTGVMSFVFLMRMNDMP